MIGKEEERSMDEEANGEKQERCVTIGFSLVWRVSGIDREGGIGEDRIVNVGEVNGRRSIEKGSNENEKRVEQKGQAEKGERSHDVVDKGAKKVSNQTRSKNKDYNREE